MSKETAKLKVKATRGFRVGGEVVAVKKVIELESNLARMLVSCNRAEFAQEAKPEKK